MPKFRTRVQGVKITKSNETNDIFPPKLCNCKDFHKFKKIISKSGSEVTPPPPIITRNEIMYVRYHMNITLESFTNVAGV